MFSRILLVAALGVSACEREEENQTIVDGAAADPAMTMPAAEPAAPAADTLAVELTEWAVRPAADSVNAGRMAFRITNRGQYEHSFEVEGQGMEEETGKIAAGGSALLTVELRPGSYELYCPIDDSHGEHEKLGMRTTLVVR
jgi:plastocyanin